MLASLLAQAGDWTSPSIDWAALAPEIVLAIGVNIILLLDLQLAETKKWADVIQKAGIKAAN